MASKKRRSAAELIGDTASKKLWLEHAYIEASDLELLKNVEQLTLWNVTVPNGFLSQLPKLWWLDIRGGSAADVSIIQGCSGLQYLQMNQIRGLPSIDGVQTLSCLRFLSLYGLSKITDLPSFETLTHLERIEIGQMKGLSTLENVLKAPNVREILAIKTVGITQEDVDAINQHKILTHFAWHYEDVPAKVWRPIMAQINLPKTKSLHAEDWFIANPA